MADVKPEQFEFQSEIKQLLDILVYSLYKNKDVFVRELISNAVDALNKMQFELLTESEVEDKDSELRIDISFNSSQNKLIIEDTGIGMTRDELIHNIGTIAHSGTVDFLKKLSESKSKDQLDLIGKFGIGFYSAFMAAKEVRIITKSYKKNSQAYLWVSPGGTSYTIEETVKKQRGTRIEAVLKKDEQKFLEKETIKQIISRYSKFVPFPVYIEGEKIEVAKAIWTQPKSSLSEKDYIDFYNFFDNTAEEPETHLHLSSDAPVQFNAILFIPRFSLENLGLFKADPGVDLYSRKVLIQKGSREILPEYLRFIRGVVDSEDIPLNISRESIQNNVKIDKIRKHITKKILQHLESIKKRNWNKYLEIWEKFSRNLKEGVAVDFESREKLAPLLLFYSSVKDNFGYTDLPSYAGRMKPDQKEIYTLSGLDLNAIDRNPALEAFKKKDMEVLYLDDPLDEFVVDHLGEFQGKAFKPAAAADIKLDRDKKTGEAVDPESLKKFAAYLKKLYGNKVEDVRISQRLVDSPSILVQPAGGASVQMEKILKMANKEYEFSRKVLEINPESPLIREMVRIHDECPQSEKLRDLSLQLLDNMLLQEGVMEKIDDVVPRIQEIMLTAAKNITK
ncbi:MAG: molecular chaperone HtpG [Candidatus Aminicenantes bacterium]